jgi:hypothetical protein
VHTLRLARHPNANSLILKLPNKIEHVLTEMQMAQRRPVSETRGSTWVSLPYALLWCASCERFCCIFIAYVQIKCVSVACMFHLPIKLIYNFLVIFRSFRNVTPNYNIALMGNSDSLYELSPGTLLFVRPGTACTTMLCGDRKHGIPETF